MLVMPRRMCMYNVFVYVIIIAGIEYEYYIVKNRRKQRVMCKIKLTLTGFCLLCALDSRLLFYFSQNYTQKKE